MMAAQVAITASPCGVGWLCSASCDEPSNPVVFCAVSISRGRWPGPATLAVHLNSLQVPNIIPSSIRHTLALPSALASSCRRHQEHRESSNAPADKQRPLVQNRLLVGKHICLISYTSSNPGWGAACEPQTDCLPLSCRKCVDASRGAEVKLSRHA